MGNKEIIVCTSIVCLVIALLTYIASYRTTKEKNRFIDSLPNTKRTYMSVLLNYEPLKKYLVTLTSANGMADDSPEVLLRESIRSVLIGILLLMGMFKFGQKGIGIALLLFMTVYPYVRRILDRSDYKKKYISGFYTFLNYITQYLSGGVEMKQALIEVEKLIPEENVIKPKLKDVISRNAIAGFAGDTYISALEELNRGLDYNEINSFISTARRAQSYGDPITDTLLGQIDDIYKRVEIEKRGHIATYESKFGIGIILFAMLPVLAMFCIPIFASAILSLGVV
ncbi:MAG: hypothetical protein Q4B60_05360 [Erysipelotrichaceae bacterium]|nr:hypothetical protein [Erysipelotrichaceae bacterium]